MTILNVEMSNGRMVEVEVNDGTFNIDKIGTFTFKKDKEVDAMAGLVDEEGHTIGVVIQRKDQSFIAFSMEGRTTYIESSPFKAAAKIVWDKYGWEMLRREARSRYDKANGITARGYKGDDESGYNWATLTARDVSDEEICSLVDMYEYHGGPGRPFAHRPWVRRTSTRILVTQHCGLDI